MELELNTKDQKTSYALGMDIGLSFTRLPLKVDLEAAIQGIRDTFAGKTDLLLDQKEFIAVMQDFQQSMRDAAKKHNADVSAKNQKQEIEFLAKNAKAPGVQTTASGLQYKVLTEGKGAKPGRNSTVSVHYTGTLPDGTIFDSSVKRGTPATFGVGQVISGWTEALQLMPEGSKYILYIPSRLAYGPQGAGEQIGPDQMLIFEVELLKIIG